MIKIKKCKKLNCSEIKIYDSESELVKEYNKNLKQDPKQIKRSEKTDQEVIDFCQESFNPDPLSRHVKESFAFAYNKARGIS